MDRSGPPKSLAKSLARKKRHKRGQGPHPGVYLLPPKGLNKSWRVQWRDPETNQRLVKNLTAADAKTQDSRTAHAVSLFKQLRRRREEIAAGAEPHRAAGKQLSDALKGYFDGVASTLKPTTVIEYRAAADALLKWSDTVGISTVRHLTATKIAAFPVWLTKQPKQVRKLGGRRGQMHDGGKLSTHTVNKLLSGTRIILNALRRHGVVRLSSDEIADNLRAIKAPMELKPFLRPKELAMLLDACREHDGLLFKITRDRTAKARHKPIQEFIEFVLFTGLRISEALGIEGRDVYPDQHEIHVRAEVAKYGIARTLDLSVSSTLMAKAKEWSEREGRLFPVTEGVVEASLRRLIDRHGAPKCGWHAMRRSTGTYLANAPGIWGAASLFVTAKQLGHGVDVAQKHYLGRIKVKPEAKTLEQAMGI